MNEDEDKESNIKEKRKQKLYYDQKQLLDTFLEHHAITQAQYDKSLSGLTEKMGMTEQSQR